MMLNNSNISSNSNNNDQQNSQSSDSFFISSIPSPSTQAATASSQSPNFNFIKFSEFNINNVRYNPLIDNYDKKLSTTDDKLIELCFQLHKQTFQQSKSSLKTSSSTAKQQLTDTDKTNQQNKTTTTPNWLDCDEFSQAGIKQCVNFCMQLPGNRELCTEDRAKLLKYGAYEIVLLRLASRYSLLDDKLVLSNGETVSENDLMQHAFGCYGHTFFQYCRHLNKLNLTYEEFALFECCIFYTYDRPLIKDRSRVEQLQMKYCELLRYLCVNNHRHDEFYFTKLILSLMKLRALDALSKFF